MPLVNQTQIKKILADFNAQGKSLEQIELEREADNKAKMDDLHKDPANKKLWAEVAAETDD